MKKNIFVLLVLLISLGLYAQKKEAYVIYKSNARKISYKRMLKKLPKAQVVLFGEYHNNPISHWLQLEIAKDLKKKDVPLSIGAEMFETDQQEFINLYVKDSISADEFEQKMRLWPNFTTDYQPLFEWAKQNKVQWTATNVPRAFASKVYKEGGFEALEGLSENEKSWVAPLPIPYDKNLKTYKNMLELMGGEHANPDIVKAQAIKDATMAYFIWNNLKDEHLFLHLNGAYHSNFYEGIAWYLNQYAENIEIITLTTVEQKDIYTLDEEYKEIADYIICVPESMTKTY
ncbi:ChaN family lipoprotein [Psychroflexus maritimus]|uniref:ChaN family lipoprotein n=1 Tax=Psychroflexus maritimus TaxID=2714865 RepID=A0A967DZJ1_9FLAO|nr:ChaN family lipoprotein [Psychroflexus maritimus]NGZ90258.1 ChaN family lipoprotein [Psychroflexus maritimus]